MKKEYISLIILSLVLLCISCSRKPDELPPIKEGYENTIQLPEPEVLSSADRQYLEELRDEYINSINKK